MYVGTIMHTDLITVAPETTLVEARDLIEKHGGRVTLGQPKTGKGLEVKVTLPKQGMELETRPRG